MAGNANPRGQWHKSTYSDADGCVECAVAGPVVGVRDSKDPGGPSLDFDFATWQAFVGDIKLGRFDRPAPWR